MRMTAVLHLTNLTHTTEEAEASESFPIHPRCTSAFRTLLQRCGFPQASTSLTPEPTGRRRRTHTLSHVATAGRYTSSPQGRRLPAPVSTEGGGTTGSLYQVVSPAAPSARPRARHHRVPSSTVWLRAPVPPRPMTTPPKIEGFLRRAKLLDKRGNTRLACVGESLSDSVAGRGYV